MNAVIIDDELSNRLLLSSMLGKHCPHVQVLGTSGNVDDAYELILTVKPDLIFLDIKMPGRNGFDLLRRFDKLNFAVIFVTGYDEYAVKAFEFNAIAYILKPIDFKKLIAAVDKVNSSQYAVADNVIHFVHSIGEKSSFIQKISVHSSDKVTLIDVDDIVYITADRGYCEILDIHKNRYVCAKPLSEYEDLLDPCGQFIRVNKSFLINIKHIHSYTKGSECVVQMNGIETEIEVSRRKKTEVLSMLKEKLHL